MSNDAARVVCLSTLLVLLAACGGGDQSAPVTALPDLPAAVTDLASLPALPPGGRFHPARITSAVTATRTGDQAVDFSPASVTLAGAQALFDVGPGEMGFAVFEFVGSPSDELASVEYVVSNRDFNHSVYVAISNYAEGAWEFFGRRNQDTAQLVPTGGEGDYASPTGYSYVAVFAFDDGDFDLDFVRVTYGNRYPVSGQVLNRAGIGIGDVLISSSLGIPPVVTDATGSFTLPAVPDGSWHLMATKAGWVFFDNPTTVAVSGADVGGVEFLGERNLSHLDPLEDEEPNDVWWQAPEHNETDIIEEWLSASDDPVDCYAFAFNTPGVYYLRYEGDHSLLFPNIAMRDLDGNFIDQSEWIRSGVLYMPFTIADSRWIVLEVSCQGGGGQYTLSTGSGPLYGISGSVTAGGELEFACVGMDAPGELTYVYAHDWSGDYESLYRLPAVYTVSADPLGEDPYTYLMNHFSIDITAGDATGVDFSGFASFLADEYEPNDTDATAYEIAALPFETTLPANIGDTDADDWYKVTPTAGKWVVVCLHYNYGINEYDLRTVYMNVENHDSTEAYWSFSTNPGSEVRFGPCDGNEYYIHVWTTDNRRHGINLSVEEYDGYQVDIGGLWGSFGIMNARVDVHNFEYDWMRTYYTANTGRTEIPFKFKDGETLHAEFFRYGLTCDRYTDTITVEGADELVWFRAVEDGAGDHWEPNDSYGKLVAYPLSSSATISAMTDPIDKYVFTPLSADPLHVVIESAPDDMEFQALLLEHNPEVYLGAYSWQGNAEFLLNTSGTIMHRLEIACNGGEGSYHIVLNESPGYMLSGKVLDSTSNPVEDAYVYDPAYGRVWESGWSAEEDYELGPFAPGTYDIYVYAANYEAAPASPWEVTFSNSDISQDFTLNVNVTDVGEPDDDWTMAIPVASGVAQTMNLNNDTDTQDWRMFTAGPGLISLNITMEDWAGNVNLALYDTDGTTQLENSNSFGAGFQRIDYYLPVLGTYYICAWGGANEYTLTADY